jgi:hypothetical protein
MTTKKVLLALAATSLLAFGSVAPVFAQDSDDGASTEAPVDPGADQGDAASDPGTDEGAGDASGDAGGEPQQ